MNLRRIISALALALALALTATAQQDAGAKPGEGPKLVIESTTHDFGEVKPGSPLRYSFKVKNTGKGDLLIQSVTPG